MYVATISMTQKRIMRLERRSATTQGQEGGGDHMRQSGDMATSLKPMHHYTTYSGL